MQKGNLQLPTPPPMELSTWVQFLVVQKIASPLQGNISISETNCIIHWNIEIYLVDNIIILRAYILNNWGQKFQSGPGQRLPVNLPKVMTWGRVVQQL